MGLAQRHNRFRRNAAKSSRRSMMQIAKQQVALMPQKLSENCSLENIQYHLYVIEKIKNGIARTETEGAISQQDAEKKLAKWVTLSSTHPTY
jgi:hypothetical protein